MKKQKKKHLKRVRKLIVGTVLCAIIFSVSTYAWFVGMKTVNVSSFQVNIAAIDGLSLSINGKDFDNSVAINSTNYSTAYTNNTNSWGGDGLIPVSSVGVINTTSSRLTMYEKGSLTATPGGYRLMASEVENSGAAEADGYIAFDLFVKNLSGTEYYTTNNVANEEAIYLTIDSKVDVATGGVENTGIENSVRVGFAQIGRVKADTSTEGTTITGITCTTAGAVTGICSSRPAQIWEPNDMAHVANARSWYNKSCWNRTGLDLTTAGAYGAHCTELADNTYYQTYAVSGEIDYTHKVDVYDGEDLNGYEDSVASIPTAGKLMAYDYFRDTEKNYSGTERPTFMTLAPNSITKVRVYVWIEGQDVDNYDFASLGKQISVKFGFTKERYYDTDLPYDSTDTAELPNDLIKSEHVESGS